MEACGNDQLDLPNALAAGVTDKLWEISDIVQVLEDFENQRKTEPSLKLNVSGSGRAILFAPHSQTEQPTRFTASQLKRRRPSGLDVRRWFGFMKRGRCQKKRPPTEAAS